MRFCFDSKKTLRHQLPDLKKNPWRRYELLKELLPPCKAREYEERVKEIEARALDELQQAEARRGLAKLAAIRDGVVESRAGENRGLTSGRGKK